MCVYVCVCAHKNNTGLFLGPQECKVMSSRDQFPAAATLANLWGRVTVAKLTLSFFRVCRTVCVRPSSMYSCLCSSYWGQWTSPGPLGELRRYQEKKRKKNQIWHILHTMHIYWEFTSTVGWCVSVPSYPVRAKLAQYAIMVLQNFFSSSVMLPKTQDSFKSHLSIRKQIMKFHTAPHLQSNTVTATSGTRCTVL